MHQTDHILNVEQRNKCLCLLAILMLESSWQQTSQLMFKKGYLFWTIISMICFILEKNSI